MGIAHDILNFIDYQQAYMIDCNLTDAADEHIRRYSDFQGFFIIIAAYLFIDLAENFKQQALYRRIKWTLHHHARNDFRVWFFTFYHAVFTEQFNRSVNSRAFPDARGPDNGKAV